MKEFILNNIATSPNELKQLILEDFWEQFPQYEEMTPTIEAILFEEEEIELWVDAWKDELTNLELIL
jgi:hypothetical protein